MATRALVDSSINAFWDTARSARPTTPQDLLRRSQALPSKKSVSQKLAKRVTSGSVPIQSARRQESDAEVQDEFRSITVELSGREGFNGTAINGIWRFWRVRNGRLAFRREVEFEVERDDIQEATDAHAETTGADGTAGVQEDVDTGATPCSSRGGNRGVATVRLFLFYMPQVDTWLISDAADGSGTVVADCGPVYTSGEDLGQHWRVWDGDMWREDRNITAEVAYGGPQPPTIKGLRVLQPATLPPPRAPSQRTRAHSQESRRGAAPAYALEPQAPLSARPSRVRRR